MHSIPHLSIPEFDEAERLADAPIEKDGLVS